MSDLISQLKERLELIEKSLMESVTNHNGLLVRKDELIVLLEMASKSAEECCEKDVCDAEVISAQDAEIAPE